MLHKNSIKNSLYIFFSSLAIELSRLVKISFMLGSKISFFSAVNIIAPMAGVFGGTFRALSLFFIHSILKAVFIGGSIFPFIGYHIPHFFASIYWNSGSRLVKLAIPLICMAAFIAHPVGGQSIPYALLWLIPISIALLNKNSVFLKAIGSTFTAHAIGSTIWIYNTAMSPQAWISLIPVALMERMMFASGMVIVYFVYNSLKNAFKQRSFMVRISRLFGTN